MSYQQIPHGTHVMGYLRYYIGVDYQYWRYIKHHPRMYLYYIFLISARKKHIIIKFEKYRYRDEVSYFHSAT